MRKSSTTTRQLRPQITWTEILDELDRLFEIADRHGVNLFPGDDFPTVCPSWGELTGSGEPRVFSQEIRDQYDADHLIGEVRS